MSGQRLDVGSLLTIDVSAEVRKLVHAQLQGPFQLPAELVRLAMRRGASAVQVRLDRGRISVVDNGDPFGSQWLDDLAALAGGGAQSNRHEALTRLEAAGQLALVAATGFEFDLVQIEAADRGQIGTTLTIRPGGATAVASNGTRNVVTIAGFSYDRARAREWLTRVAGFATGEIAVDGKPIARRSGDWCASTSLGAHKGTLAIPKQSQGAHAWLLDGGIEVAHVTMTNCPPVELALELSDYVEPGSSPADVRRAFNAMLAAVVQDTVTTLCGLVTRDDLPDHVRSRLVEILLETARLRLHAKQIATLPLLRTATSDARFGRAALIDLEKEARTGGRNIVSLLPDQDPADHVIDERVFVLDPRERAILSELLELHFIAPPHRSDDHRLLGGLSDLLSGLGKRVVSLFGSPNAVDDATLSIEQRALKSGLRGFIGDLDLNLDDVLFSEDGKRPRIHGKVLWLGRDSPEVERYVASVAKDRANLYPVMLSALRGRALPPLRVRNLWSSHSPVSPHRARRGDAETGPPSGPFPGPSS